MDETKQPIPDPTVLTTEQLLREISNAVRLLEAKDEGLKDVVGEQFRSVVTQFQLVERQRVEQKLDTATAVAAALAAAKEAVTEQTAASEKSITKSETATAEQLRQLTATFTTAIGGVTDSISDIKDRIGNIESSRDARMEGITETRRQSEITFGQVVSLGMALLFIVSIVITAALATHGFTK
jgi:chromosome segregation ATPase